MTVSTGLTRARRSKAALALDPIPASKVQSDPLEIAELDKHNSFPRQGKPGRAGSPYAASSLPASKQRWPASLPAAPPTRGLAPPFESPASEDGDGKYR